MSTQLSHSGADWRDYWPADPQAPGTDTNVHALWPLNPIEGFELNNNAFINCGYNQRSKGKQRRYNRNNGQYGQKSGYSS